MTFGRSVARTSQPSEARVSLETGQGAQRAVDGETSHAERPIPEPSSIALPGRVLRVGRYADRIWPPNQSVVPFVTPSSDWRNE